MIHGAYMISHDIDVRALCSACYTLLASVSQSVSLASAANYSGIPYAAVQQYLQEDSDRYHTAAAHSSSLYSIT